MTNRTIRIGLVIIFFAASVFAAHDLYSQAELKTKGLKAFSGEYAKARAAQKAPDVQEIPAPVREEPDAAVIDKGRTASSLPETKDYNVLLAEIEQLKKESSGLQRELDVMRNDQNIFGKDFVNRKDEKTPAALKDEAIRKLKEKNRELEAKVKEAKERDRLEKAKLYFELGNSYARAKLYKKAIEAFSASVAADPGNGDAYYNLGFLYQRYQGDTAKSIDNFKKYLDCDPPPDKKKEVKYVLEMLRTGREWVTAYY